MNKKVKDTTLIISAIFGFVVSCLELGSFLFSIASIVTGNSELTGRYVLMYLFFNRVEAKIYTTYRKLKKLQTR